MDLCRRFDLRFTIVADRFNQAQFQVISECVHSALSLIFELQDRSVEMLKDRYYSICNRLTKVTIMSVSLCVWCSLQASSDAES